MTYTIKNFLLEKELNIAKERLEKLTSMDAPKVMLEGMKKQIESLESGELDVKGEAELLDYTFEQVEIRKGSMGKQYLVFDNLIKYFPQAKYGRFITKG